MDTNAFEINRGDDTSIEIQILDDENESIDLTGYTIFFTAKTKPTAPDSEAVLSKEAINGSSEGMVEINFTASETNLLKPRSYWWDIQLEKDGIISSTKRQLFRVVADITRRIEDGIS